ncbi:MAG: ribulose-phosphate 3-epimerase [Actinomycetota bacterium]
MGKLAASILAADFANLGAQVALVEPHVDVFHIDVMDGHFVPPITLGGVVVKSIRPHTTRTFHGHLMIENPEAQFDDLAEAGLDVVSFHLEAVTDAGPLIRKARGGGMGVGLTINMETPVEDLFPYLDEIDDVMLMSIRPGWSGQELNPAVFDRVEAVRAELDRRGLEADVEVDGGITLENARRAMDAGASVLVAASAIFWASDPAGAARELAEIAGEGGP